MDNTESLPGEEETTRRKKEREEKIVGEAKPLGRRGKHLVVICMERYLLGFSHRFVLFSDRLTELQEVRTARKNKSTGSAFES